MSAVLYFLKEVSSGLEDHSLSCLVLCEESVGRDRNAVSCFVMAYRSNCGF